MPRSQRPAVDRPGPSSWLGVFAAGVVLVTLVLGVPATAQVNQPFHQDGWILAAAHTPGKQGSIWRTDLWIVFNTSSHGTVTLYFCEAEKDNTGVQGHTINVSGDDRVSYYEDVVDQFLDVGSGSWLGAIHYTASPDVQVWARVYSISPDGTESYGQLIEGIPTAHMSANQESTPDSRYQQWLSAGKHTADGRYRVNVGVVNPTDVEVNVRISMFDATGSWPDSGTKERYVTLPPYSMAQLGDPFGDVNGGEWSNHQIRVLAYGEGGGVFAYSSVVDNATNDAFFVRGVKQLTQTQLPGLNCTQHSDGWLLAAARTPGAQNSLWRTDVWIATKDSGPTITFYMCESNKDNTGVQGYQVQTTPGQMVYYIEDVVQHFLNVGSTPWLGAIHYTSSSEIQVWARVYSVSADGTASYGQLVEGIPTSDMSPPSGAVASTDEYQWMFAAKHTADDRFRVNLGIVNPTAVTCLYWVSVFSGGTTDTSFQQSVPPYSMFQLGDPLAVLDGGEWSNKAIRVQPSTENGGGFAYLSVVDNATNDAFFVRGVKRLNFGGV